MAYKAIDKDYLLQTLKDFNTKILSSTYQKYTDFASDFNSSTTYAVDDYVIYFDQLKYTTNTLSNVYDGYDLKDADFGDKN